MRIKGTARTSGASIVLADGATGQTTLTTNSSASRTITFPDATDTVVTLAAAQTLTNKTFTSPTLTTPALGAATATTINGLTITSTTGGVLTIANSKTLSLTTGSLTLVSNASDTTATFPASGSITLVDTATAQTLTNKTLSSTVSVNKVAITAPATSATLTLADGSTLATSGAYSTTLTATDATNVTLPTTGTLSTLAGAETFTNKTLTSPKLNENVALTSTSTQLNYLTNAGGTTGTDTTNIVFSTSPTLVTPTLGVASATSINKVAITAPATSATLTLSDGSSLITSGGHSITLTSTGATNVTLPTTGTAATLAGSETFTNKRLSVGGSTWCAFADASDATKLVKVEASGITTGKAVTLNFTNTANDVITFPAGVAGAATLISRASTDTVTNKTFQVDTSDACSFASGTGTARKVAFDIIGATNSTTTTLDFNQTQNRTITFPDESGTLITSATGVDLSTAQTLTNKTLTVDGASKCIFQSATGTARQVLIDVVGATNSTSTTLDFNQTSSRTITFPDATTTVVGTDTTDTLTNKTLTSPKLNENVALTTTSTKLNYLTSATGTTGTTSTNIVFSTSPTLVTPALGVATATSVSASSYVGVGSAGSWHSAYTSTNTPDDDATGLVCTFPLGSTAVYVVLWTGGTSGSGGADENYVGIGRGGSYSANILLGAQVAVYTSDVGNAGVTDGKIGVCFVDSSKVTIYNRRGGTRSFTVHIWGR